MTETFTWQVNDTTYIAVAMERDGAVSVNAVGTLTQGQLREFIDVLKLYDAEGDLPGKSPRPKGRDPGEIISLPPDPPISPGGEISPRSGRV